MSAAKIININLKCPRIPKIEKLAKNCANLFWPINWGYKIYCSMNTCMLIPLIIPKNNKVKINKTLLSKEYWRALIFLLL